MHSPEYRAPWQGREWSGDVPCKWLDRNTGRISRRRIVPTCCRNGIDGIARQGLANYAADNSQMLPNEGRRMEPSDDQLRNWRIHPSASEPAAGMPTYVYQWSMKMPFEYNRERQHRHNNRDPAAVAAAAAARNRILGMPPPQESARAWMPEGRFLASSSSDFGSRPASALSTARQNSSRNDQRPSMARTWSGPASSTHNKSGVPGTSPYLPCPAWQSPVSNRSLSGKEPAKTKFQA
eukprot:gnl/TRDRNA2_/TRDRNA2_202766_c0_seq1.p1 gnl/TRDRNA2_/TRDRNA2_202766_c0~~gnl/TRDRNA2_/TRDRNA2_202766_c0_seq1.p1  ORF type:complete len:237 (+),score=18.31 gnl/TRDRNA2_/TRDRNA2_202766_c0_seq1:27-737(+)